MDEIVYIHYGDSKFKPDLVSSIHKAIGNKPNFGLWASRENSEFGWKDWCEIEEYALSSLSSNFKFTIDKNTRILKIDDEHLEDIKKYFIPPALMPLRFHPIDFERIIGDGYDAVEYNHISILNSAKSGDKDAMEILDWFYGWDCDSIVIFNPEVVNVIE